MSIFKRITAENFSLVYVVEADHKYNPTDGCTRSEARRLYFFVIEPRVSFIHSLTERGAKELLNGYRDWDCTDHHVRCL